MRGGAAVIILGRVVVAATGSSSAQVPSLGTYHALVIGNQAYKSLRPLQTPVADAAAVADVLRREYGFASVELLTNATRTDMVRAFDELRRKLGPNDNLLVYYAGHGWLDRESDRGYWLPADAEGDSRANWLSNADITDTLRALKAKHVLVVADSCYSGTLTRSVGVTPLAPPEILVLAQRRARTALVSGGLEPVADVGGGGRHSVFAKAFLDALRGNQGAADLATLFGAIRRQVLLNATQTPEYADIRQAGHDGGDFIFVRPGTAVSAVPPRAEPPKLAVREKRRQEPSSLAPLSLVGVWRWSCCGGRYEGRWEITTQDTDGRFSGRFSETNATDIGTIEGRLHGDRVEFVRRWTSLLVIHFQQEWFARLVRNGPRFQMTGGRWQGSGHSWDSNDFEAERLSDPRR